MRVAEIRSQLITVTLYVLTYEGSSSLWPSIAHFRHHELDVPNWLLAVTNGAILPMLAAFLVVVARQRDKTRIPIAFFFGPLVLHIFLGIAEDSLYPPWHTEMASILIAAGVQTLSALAGWRLARSIGTDSPDFDSATPPVIPPAPPARR
jgi:hypothetical protein